MAGSEYYASHSTWSDPGQFTLPSWSGDLHVLSRVINAIIRHPVGRSSVPFTEAQRQDLLLRTARELLARAAERSVLGTAEHDETRKVGGVCRDFALLAVSALRHINVPARLRVGFADYFTPDFYEDHWVCQWHDGTSWHLLDVECAARPVETWEYDFAPTDVPRSRFLFASDAWAATKNGSLDAARCGVSAVAIAGSRFIAASLMRDQAAMLKVELKPWDVWGPALLPMAMPDKEVLASEELDAVAKRLETASEPESVGPPNGYESWGRPASVTSYPFGEPLEIGVL
jgi:Transglutaminase-like superfamily